MRVPLIDRLAQHDGPIDLDAGAVLVIRRVVIDLSVRCGRHARLRLSLTLALLSERNVRQSLLSWTGCVTVLGRGRLRGTRSSPPSLTMVDAMRDIG
jgi:hypothetical protein